MKITETSVQDITYKNIDQKKVEFADNIISNLEDKIFKDFQILESKINEKQNWIQEKKNDIKINKTLLNKVISEYQRKLKENELSILIEKLCLNEDYMKTKDTKGHIKLVLKVLDTLAIEKINSYILDFKKILNLD